MTSGSFPVESLISSSDTLRHSSISSWERILQRRAWFWGGREDKGRRTHLWSCFILVGEPWLDGDAMIFHLGKISSSLLSMLRSVLYFGRFRGVPCCSIPSFLAMWLFQLQGSPVATVKVEIRNPRHRVVSLVSHQNLWNWLLPKTYCRGR